MARKTKTEVIGYMCTASCAWTRDDGVNVAFSAGNVYQTLTAKDVKGKEKFFQPVHASPVERATARPGEVRNVVPPT